MSETTYDYIIVGGGVAGCVTANRLHEYLPSASILILENGGDPKSHTCTHDIPGFAHVRGSLLDYSLDTVPQKWLGGKVLKQWGGKCLGGSGSINAQGWTRGPATDYDRWAELTGDPSWSWENLLPCFRRMESFNGSKVDESLHGQEGPLKVTKTSLETSPWPLRDTLDRLYSAQGNHSIDDINSGNPLGYGPSASLWINGQRQYPHDAYDLSQVKVRLNTKVHKVLFEPNPTNSVPTVRGVLTLDGEEIQARQVIICAGVYHSPQILLLSGIGPPGELSKHIIQTVVPNQFVGKNLRDDLNVRLLFRLTNPERDGGVGSTAFVNNLAKFAGRFPTDYMVFAQCAREQVLKALGQDGVQDPESHPLLQPGSVHQETFLMYMALLSSVQQQTMGLQQDGSYVTTSSYILAPTSRGVVSLNSADPHDPPRIDPGYFSTETDRLIMRDTLRRVAKLLMFADGEAEQIVKEEIPLHKSGEPLTPELSDREMDERIFAGAESGAHPSGTCGMSRVLDSRLRVLGVNGLRVVDASSFPDGISAHIQAAVYALAEKGEEMIAEDARATNGIKEGVYL